MRRLNKNVISPESSVALDLSLHSNKGIWGCLSLLLNVSYTYSTHSKTDTNKTLLFCMVQISSVFLEPWETQHIVHCIIIFYLNLKLLNFRFTDYFKMVHFHSNRTWEKPALLDMIKLFQKFLISGSVLWNQHGWRYA